ncbi:MAG: threonine aldolase, partial [Treponema sp.]|jgi:threonine aldolase|nr:threonine aldolase [Treponema sp.]
VQETARAWGLPVHLDGARIFNAAAALGLEARDIAARVDSVMFCLSKGLCAPVGSLLAGPRDFIAEARLKRKILGGGLRQAGVLAAAGILALTEQTARLNEDHARARKLASALGAIPGISLEEGDINMVFFSFPPAREPGTAQRIVEGFAQGGVKISPPGAGQFRFVTHYWIGDAELDRIIKTAKEVFSL